MKKNNKKRKMNKILITDFLLSVPAMIGYTVLFALPVFVGFYYSLMDWDGISKSYNFIGLENYIKVLSDQRVINTLGVTVKYALMLVACVMIISLATALVLNSIPRGKNFFGTWLFLPALFSLVTTGFMFQNIYSDIFPMIGELLGKEMKSPLIKSDTALYGILFANLWAAICLPTVLIFASLKSVPSDLKESVELDGGGAIAKFKAVILPYIFPTLSMIFLTSLKGGLGMYEYSAILTSGGPGRATQTLTFLIKEYGFDTHKYSYASALSFDFLILMIFITAIFKIATRGKEVDES